VRSRTRPLPSAWVEASDEALGIALALGRADVRAVVSARYWDVAFDVAAALVGDADVAAAIVEDAFNELVGRAGERGSSLRAAILAAVHRGATATTGPHPTTAWAALPDVVREPLILALLGGCAYGEIAIILGVPERVVRRRLRAGTTERTEVLS
jgi:hypothetical protein